MASSLDSPENTRQRRAWVLWQELLPGIEEFIVRILPQEKLSPSAEERRQYFVERLDILKLPPTLPPRAGRRISQEVLQESERVNGIPAEDVPEISQLVENDFAAYQREISRNLVIGAAEPGRGAAESESEKGVKVYDDIDPTESTKNDDSDDDISALYEIPVARQQLPPHTSEDSLSQPADISSLANANSTDDVSDDVLDASSPVGQPPPLPPRKDAKLSDSGSRTSVNTSDDKPPDLPSRHPVLEKKVSESGSRSSVNASDDRPPELPFRPPQLTRRSEISPRSEKSDVSDGDSTSYESFDEDHDANRPSKSNVKLPMRPKKKTKKASKHPASKARSSATWEINAPFKKLENILISGELLHKGKLSWNRRTVAISNGSMALYKPEKEARPVFVISLAGYEASVGDRDGRKGFEINMVHPNEDSHLFAVDFKEWAAVWCEYVNNVSKGVLVMPFNQHLARSFSGDHENSINSSRIEFNLGDYEMYEEYNNNNNNNSNVFDTPPPTPQTPRSKTGSQRSWRRPPLRTVSSAPQTRSVSGLEPDATSASTCNLTLARWDWKTLFYQWSFPLDEVIVGLRRVSYNLKGNLSAKSSSSLSINSNGSESDDSTKPRLRGNKVMRMGSFAYRATQFFENIGKKTTTKRKSNSLSSPLESDISFRDGIQEESSHSSMSVGVSPLSETCLPGWHDGPQALFSSSPLSSEGTLPSPPPVPDIPLNVKVQGNLNIFSSFNKRRWGLRWCLVRENMFECYRSQTSQQCELGFLLRKCIIRHAVAETKSPLALMLVEHDKEKITVEPPSKEEMSQWLTVLMMETSTDAIPPGLEEYFRESEDPSAEEQIIEPDYSDIPAASCVLRSALTAVPDQHNTVDTMENGVAVSDSLTSGKEDTNIQQVQQTTADVYTEVVKRPASTRLVEAGNEEKEEKKKKMQKETKHPRFMDNLAVYNVHKNTTDSGFYSVQETNSDSDSGCEYTKEVISPAQENCSPQNKEDLTPFITACSKNGKETTDSDIATGSHRTSEEEDDESILERTMTAEDFTESLEPGNICAAKVGEASGSSDVNVCVSWCKTDGHESSTTPGDFCFINMAPDFSERDTIPNEINSVDLQYICDDKRTETHKPGNSKQGIQPKEAKEAAEGAVGSGESEKTGANHTPNCEVEVSVPQKRDLSSQADSSGLGNCELLNQRCPAVDRKGCTGRGYNKEGIGRLSGCGSAKSDKEALTGQLSLLKKMGSELCGSFGKAKNHEETGEGELKDPVFEDQLLDSWGLSAILSKGLCSDNLQGSLHNEYKFAWQGSGLSVPNIPESSFPYKVQLRTVSKADSDARCCHGDTSELLIPSENSANADAAAASEISSFAARPLPSPAKEAGTEDSNPAQLVTDLRDRISRLREKLIQIKRKRIAVRDKRVRAFSAEERAVCDKEYLFLESQCNEMSRNIQKLEEELKQVIAA